jgi:ADP-heptose:LPS heptosyltransferase
VPLDRSWFRSPARYALALGTEAVAPGLRRYAARRAHQPPSPPAQWHRVCILGSAHIGDIMYRTASLPYLRQALPGAQLTYVCAPSTAELLEGNPSVDDVLPLIDDNPAWRQSTATAEAFRARAIDAALCTDHIAYEKDLWMVTQLGIPNRVGFAHKGLSALSTIPIYPRCPQPAPAFFRDMVATLAGSPAAWDLTPILHLTQEDHIRAAAAWEELGIVPGRTVIACTLTSRQPDPVWPAERFRQTIELCAQGRNIEAVFCGSAADAPTLRAVADACTIPSHVLAGRLGIRAFAAFLARCNALLGTDSGPRHLANAVSTPVVFVRRLAVAAVEVGVYCANEIDVAPAGEYLSRAEQANRLARLNPADVAPVLARVLQEHAG